MRSSAFFTDSWCSSVYTFIAVNAISLNAVLVRKTCMTIFYNDQLKPQMQEYQIPGGLGNMQFVSKC